MPRLPRPIRPIRPLRLRLHPPSSLRARLALWYFLVVGLTLVCFGAVLLVVVGAYMGNGRDTTLRERAALIADRVRMTSAGVRLGDTGAFPIERGTAAYLFDGRGRLVGWVVGPRTVPPQPGVRDVLTMGRGGFGTVGKVRVYMDVLRDGHGHIRGVVQVAQNTDATVSGFRTEGQVGGVLLLAIIVMLAIGTAAGLFLAGRALGPIDRITRTAQAIGAGNLQGRLGLAPRADEVGRLAATFDGMLDRLERAFAQQRQFVADASHEMRTPLAIIRSDLDILRRRPRSVAEHEEFERGLDEEIARLSALVEDLLTLARADSGQAELASEFVYLDALVAAVAAAVGRLAEAKGVALEMCLERDVAVMGDPARLHQLALNLLGNAVKYTPAGGHVRVTVGARDGAARLEVADSGVGIPTEDLPRVFDRFYRADEARSRAAGGVGLGLAIARWCAEAHGGQIAVQSRPGAGSVFTVSLPLALIDDGEDTKDQGDAVDVDGALA
jgi:signal transduction histidine kinase